jgi:enterochelin esterase-like enzyme
VNRQTLLLLLCASLAAQTPDPNKSGHPHDMTWFNPPKTPMPGVVHKGFHSASMKTKVGYNIYLPPGYETGRKRYPVIYWLHGRGGTESSNGYPVQFLADAIKSGAVLPSILVYVCGGSQTNYADSFDRKYMGETVIIKELIPHIDKTYRTIASRDGRAIQGMSMGGFGAMRLGVKYPDLFSSIVAFAGGYRWPEEVKEAHMSWKEMFNSDPEIIRANHPETWAHTNVAKLRGRMAIQMYIGADDPSLKANRRMHAVLTELAIAHGYQEFDGIAHNLNLLSEKVRSENFEFAARSFGKRAKTGASAGK